MTSLANVWLTILLTVTVGAATAQPGGHGPNGPGGFSRGGHSGPAGMPPMGMPGRGAPSSGPRGMSGPEYSPRNSSFSGPRDMSPGSYPGSPRGGVPSTRFSSVPSQYGGPVAGAPGDSGPFPRSSRSGSPSAPPDISRMQQALRQGDYATIGRESDSVRSRTEGIRNMSPELPVQDRIQIPLINHMYRQGADLMEEGRNSRDDAKIRMGIQQINQANEKLNRLHGPQSGPAPR